MRQLVTSDAIDRTASYVIVNAGQSDGICLVARRGNTARLSALAVAPGRRGTGLARLMLERVINESRERGDETLELEVFESNFSAVRLYKSCGFQQFDRLLGFERSTDVSIESTGPLLRVPGGGKFGTALAMDPSYNLPWQLAAECVAAATIPWMSVSLDHRATALVDFSRADAVLLRIVHTHRQYRLQGAARRLIDAIATEAGHRPLRVPQLIPETHEIFARTLGFATSELAQLRMILHLVARP